MLTFICMSVVVTTSRNNPYYMQFINVLKCWRIRLHTWNLCATYSHMEKTYEKETANYQGLNSWAGLSSVVTGLGIATPSSSLIYLWFFSQLFWLNRLAPTYNSDATCPYDMANVWVAKVWEKPYYLLMQLRSLWNAFVDSVSGKRWLWRCRSIIPVSQYQ